MCEHGHEKVGVTGLALVCELHGAGRAGLEESREHAWRELACWAGVGRGDPAQEAAVAGRAGRGRATPSARLAASKAEEAASPVFKNSRSGMLLPLLWPSRAASTDCTLGLAPSPSSFAPQHWHKSGPFAATDALRK